MNLEGDDQSELGDQTRDSSGRLMFTGNIRILRKIRGLPEAGQARPSVAELGLPSIKTASLFGSDSTCQLVSGVTADDFDRAILFLGTGHGGPIREPGDEYRVFLNSNQNPDPLLDLILDCT